MSLPKQMLRESDARALDRRSHQALAVCRRAKELEEQGLYEEAADALAEFWAGVGHYPALAGLDERASAEVLLRAGALTGWLGSSTQTGGAQESAKDLLSESLARFESLADTRRVAESLVELAFCYWRQGATDEARDTLAEARRRLSADDYELRALLSLRAVLIEVSATRYNDALRILTDDAPLFASSASDALRGKYHNQLAAVLWHLSKAERREDYLDRALIEYAAASFHFDEAGHTAYRAAVENNLGYLFLTASKFTEAHEHLDCARRLFVRLKDSVHIAQVDETRARVLLAEGRTASAEGVARSAVRALEGGGEQALLAEALTTHGATLARLGRHEDARRTLTRAREVAELAGNAEGAGLAELTLLEELSERLTAEDAREAYAAADRLLARTQCQETLARLRACAARALAGAGVQSQAAPGVESRGFVYASKQTESLLAAAREIARAGGAVLLTGETGTGKETLARLMHEWAGGAGEFVVYGATAGVRAEVDSPRQFGASQVGRGRTLFVAEVAELGQFEQAKLLDAVERAEAGLFVVAATARRLEEEVAAGRFSEVLFYALRGRGLELPPLRSRPEDIPALAGRFIEEANARRGKRVRFTADALAAMRRLPLLGANADELRSLIERTVERAADGSTIGAAAVETLALRHDTDAADFADPWANFCFREEVKRFEENLIERALQDARGRVSHAARLLGFRHHESLNWRLKNRNKNLLAARTPAKRRRRSIISKHD